MNSSPSARIRKAESFGFLPFLLLGSGRARLRRPSLNPPGKQASRTAMALFFQKAHQDSSRRHAQPLQVGRQRHGRPQGRERLGRQARHLPQRWAAGHGHLQPHPPRQACRPTPQRRKGERGDRSARADGSRDGKRRRARGARPCARRS